MTLPQGDTVNSSEQEHRDIRVAWSVCSGDGQFHTVSRDLSARLEDAFVARFSELSLQSGDEHHKYVLPRPASETDGWQINIKTRERVQLRRRVFLPTQPPVPRLHDGTPLEDGAPRLKSVPRGSEPLLWERMEARVKDSLPEYEVVSVDRVENKNLWALYGSFAWDLANRGGSVNERELFHFSKDVDNIALASSAGFDPRFKVHLTFKTRRGKHDIPTLRKRDMQE